MKENQNRRWFICAAFSLDVYNRVSQTLPDGWSVFLDCPAEYQTDGYFGRAYIACINEHPKTYEIIIAHRGTYSLIDGIEDFLILLGKCPLTFSHNALPFTAYVKKAISDRIQEGECHISTHTGHSLGAILAELMPAYYASQKENWVHVKTFDSPGSKPIIEDLINNRVFSKEALLVASKLVENSFSDVNAINSCNEKIDAYAIPDTAVSPYTYDQDGGVPYAPERFYYLVGFSIENQHKMQNFYRYWKASQDMPQNLLKRSGEFQWPVGFEKSYAYYLALDNHPDYWQGYVESLWTLNPDIRSGYHNNIAEFYETFVSRYLSEIPTLASLDNKKESITWKNAESVRLAKASLNQKLYIAVITNNISLATALLAEGAKTEDRHGTERQSLLHIAILCGNFEMMLLLLNNNADVNALNAQGNTPLHLAVIERHNDVIKYVTPLIHKGAHINRLNNNGETPLRIIQSTKPSFLKEFEEILSGGVRLL